VALNGDGYFNPPPDRCRGPIESFDCGAWAFDFHVREPTQETGANGVHFCASVEESGHPQAPLAKLDVAEAVQSTTSNARTCHPRVPTPRGDRLP